MTDTAHYRATGSYRVAHTLRHGAERWELINPGGMPVGLDMATEDEAIKVASARNRERLARTRITAASRNQP